MYAELLAVLSNTRHPRFDRAAEHKLSASSTVIKFSVTDTKRMNDKDAVKDIKAVLKLYHGAKSHKTPRRVQDLLTALGLIKCAVSQLLTP